MLCIASASLMPGDRGGKTPAERDPVKIIRGIDNAPPFEKTVLTVGNFDGVHLAHQQLIAFARSLTNGTGPVVVLTFEPHPLTVVAPGRAPARLTLPDEKLKLLKAAGTDVTVIARSDPALLGLEAEKFVDDILVARFHPRHIVEGPSFGFGRGRRGNPDLLRALAASHGCEVHIVEPVRVQIGGGEAVMVSSSLIRQLLSSGRVHEAAICLGRPYALLGDVIHGHGRGKPLGFPTANLTTHEQLIPGEGVYAGRARMEGHVRPAAISIGRNPTFGGGELNVEAFVLDWDGDLYGLRLSIEFERFLRPQLRFDSPAALREQIERDVAAVRSAGGVPAKSGEARP